MATRSDFVPDMSVEDLARFDFSKAVRTTFPKLRPTLASLEVEAKLTKAKRQPDSVRSRDGSASDLWRRLDQFIRLKPVSA